MTKYIDQERARYWPVPPELMAQYRDGTHTRKDVYGYLYWRNKNGKIHRDGDKPAEIWPDGALYWYQNNLLHRNGDKPAVIHTDSSLEWFQNGLLHRFRGPAVIRLNGETQWWINGEKITREVKKWLNRKRWRGTPEQIFEFQLRFL